MSKSQITSAAAWMMSLVASISAIFSPFFASFESISEKLFLTAISALGLYTVFEVSRRVLLWWRYRKVLGRWYYATREHEQIRFIDRNVALMEFSLDRDGELAYQVHLYPDPESLTGAVTAGKRSRALARRGTARSLACNYLRDEQEIELVFQVQYNTGRAEDCDRRGLLSLKFQPDGTIDGEYVSRIWEKRGARSQPGVSAGRMFATRRLEDLVAHLTPQDQPADSYGTRAEPASRSAAGAEA